MRKKKNAIGMVIITNSKDYEKKQLKAVLRYAFLATLSMFPIISWFLKYLK